VHLLVLDESGQIDQRSLFVLGGSRSATPIRRIWHETVSEETQPAGESGLRSSSTEGEHRATREI